MSLNPALEKTLSLDKQYLEQTDVPIITVSATYREDLKGWYGMPENETLQDIVFSRAHYSMALAAVVTGWKNKLDANKAWVVDPTNYVSHEQWKKIIFTDVVGKTIARQPFLKTVKDLIDKFGRSKLPILPSITPPLLYLTENIKKPILSFHIAAGNILIEHNKKVVQVITDPHVRDEYLNNAENPKMKFCVFDDKTKTEFLEKAHILGKKVDPKKVIVTGPPVDPRVIACRQNKKPWSKKPLRICLTTGGLGTNKGELKHILNQILPQLRKRPSPYKLMLYAATHQDIKDMAVKLAQQERVAVKIIADPTEIQLTPDYENRHSTSNFYIIYHPQIVDANELLIKHAFPWADGFMTKPSGDMAYDAAASGSFLLTLKEWGEWEHNIRETFEQLGIARQAQSEHIVEQLEALTTKNRSQPAWVTQAMTQAQDLDKLYLTGTKNILQVVKNFS